MVVDAELVDELPLELLDEDSLLELVDEPLEELELLLEEDVDCTDSTTNAVVVCVVDVGDVVNCTGAAGAVGAVDVDVVVIV